MEESNCACFHWNAKSFLTLHCTTKHANYVIRCFRSLSERLSLERAITLQWVKITNYNFFYQNIAKCAQHMSDKFFGCKVYISWVDCEKCADSSSEVIVKWKLRAVSACIEPLVTCTYVTFRWNGELWQSPDDRCRPVSKIWSDKEKPPHWRRASHLEVMIVGLQLKITIDVSALL